MKNYTKKYLLLWIGILFCGGLSAQQIQVPQHYFYLPHLYNPASLGSGGSGKVWLGHAQRDLAFDMNSYAQWLRVEQPVSGGNLAWGLQVQHELDFVQRRFQAAGMLAYHLLNEEDLRLSLGGAVGVNTFSWNFNNIRVWDQTDPLASNPGAIVDLDAALGLDFHLRSELGILDAGGAIWQLPGSALSSDLLGPQLQPHVLSNARFLFRLNEQAQLGPALMFRTLLGERGLQSGHLDAGVQARFPNSGLWAGAGYRTGNGAVHLGAGMPLMGGTEEPGLDVSFSFAQPLNSSAPFGPSLELGLVYRWSRD